MIVQGSQLKLPSSGGNNININRAHSKKSGMSKKVKYIFDVGGTYNETILFSVPIITHGI